MTVEEMIAERTVKVSAALGDANGAISLKGGTPSADLSGLAAAIATIPQGGGGSGVTKVTGTFTPATTGRGFTIQTGLTNLQEIVVLADIADIANLPADCIFKTFAMKHGLSNFSSETLSASILRNRINAAYCYRTASGTNLSATEVIFNANGDVTANIRGSGFPAGQTFTWTAYGWEEPT